MDEVTVTLVGVLIMFLSRKKLEEIADEIWHKVLEKVQGISQDQILIDEALKVSHRLDLILNKFECRYVAVFIYHNATKIGLHQYQTMRFEEYNIRLGLKSIIDDYSKKPLTPYYSIIKKFETDDFVSYSSQEKPDRENERLLYEVGKLGGGAISLVPVYMKDKIIGSLMCVFPKDCELHKADETRIYLKEMVEGIEQSFNKSPRLYHV